MAIPRLFAHRLTPLPMFSRLQSTMVQRVTYRRRHAFATKSNKTKLVKTPGKALLLLFAATSPQICPRLHLCITYDTSFFLNKSFLSCSGPLALTDAVFEPAPRNHAQRTQVAA